MSSQRCLKVGVLVALAVNLAATSLAHADPLTPLTPGEVQYLDQARQIYAVSQNPVAFRSDGELLTDGRYACDKRAAGFVGLKATFVDPVLTQLAFLYLCP
jgi:hypothetical protein